MHPWYMQWRRAAMRIGPVALALTALSGCPSPEARGPEGTPAPDGNFGPYTDEERALYREAVRRMEQFEARNQRILAAGVADGRAKRFYRNQLRDWQTSFALLQWLETSGIRVRRGAAIVGVEAASIKSFQDNAAEIVLRRCADHSAARVVRDGLLMPITHAEPVVQNVVVYRYENSTWRIGDIEMTDEPCVE